MELLTVLWLAGLGVFFIATTPRQHENLLLLAWIALSLPVAYWLFRLLL